MEGRGDGRRGGDGEETYSYEFRMNHGTIFSPRKFHFVTA